MIVRKVKYFRIEVDFVKFMRKRTSNGDEMSRIHQKIDPQKTNEKDFALKKCKFFDFSYQRSTVSWLLAVLWLMDFENLSPINREFVTKSFKFYFKHKIRRFSLFSSKSVGDDVSINSGVRYDMHLCWVCTACAAINYLSQTSSGHLIFALLIIQSTTACTHLRQYAKSNDRHSNTYTQEHWVDIDDVNDLFVNLIKLMCGDRFPSLKKHSTWMFVTKWK